MVRQLFTPRRAILCALLVTASLLVVLPIMAQDSGDSTTTVPSSYTIERGDVLDVLAQEWNISLDALMKANDFTYATIIYTGDTIIVPRNAPPYGTFVANEDTTAGAGGGAVIPGDTYVIQPNDVLDTIGQEFDVSVEALIDANNITNTRRLFAGQTIIIPDDAPAYGEPLPRTSSTIGIDTTAGAGGGGTGGAEIPGQEYMIRSNDVLDTIGQEFNVSVEALIAANNITNTRRLFAGQVIIIPDDAPAYGEPLPRTSSGTTAIDTTAGAGGGVSGDVYIVHNNDTLDGIAADHNVDTTCLATSNNLTDPGKIFAGQEIVIDRSCPAYSGFDVVGDS
jgi:LysM repeat protein